MQPDSDDHRFDGEWARTRVSVHTPEGRFEGTVHHRPDSRMSDHLQDKAQRFLPLTDVTIWLDAEFSRKDAPFLLISKDYINYILPAQDGSAAA